MSHNACSMDVRKRAVEMYREGLAQPAIARQLGVSSSSVSNWIRAEGLGRVDDPFARFMAKVDKSGECWLWTGGLQPNGYAMFDVGSRMTRHRWLAHRFAYTHLRGPIPEGLDLDHLCRVRHCVNPDHLEPVTHTENVRRGVGTKLTAADVAAMRASDMRHIDLARIYGVDQSTVGKIRRGAHWRTLPVGWDLTKERL